MKNFQKKFPIFSSAIADADFSGYAFIFIYHLNDNNLPFLIEWIKKITTIAVISIPYSEVAFVKKEISKYATVITPDSVEKIPVVLEKLVSEWKHKNVILIEIGGYSSYISHKLDKVILSVEDTNQGHWNHLNSKNVRKYPVVSMAQCEVKKLENRVVGESIVRTIERILPLHFPKKKLKAEKIGVISYGGIGSSVCMALRKRNIPHVLYDLDPIKLSFAKSDGYSIATKKYLLKNSDIVIACTGKNSVLKEDSNYIKNNAILFSGSSKKVEFKELLDLKSSDKTSSNLFKKYKSLKNSFYIAYEGQPINFLDSVDPEEFDYILATMVACAKYGLKNKLKNDVYEIPLDDQLPIFNAYLKKYIL